MAEKKNSGAILGGGIGKRMNSGSKLKQFLEIGGTPILLHTVHAFCDCPAIDDIIIVVPAAEISQTDALVAPCRDKKPITIITGGATRQESSFNAIQFLHKRGDTEIIVIHDAVRPFVTSDLISQSIGAAREFGAADVAAKTVDTIIETKDGFVTSMPDRDLLYNGQTPQTFQLDLIYKAHQQAQQQGYTQTTDDVRLVVRLGHQVKVVESTFENMKVTTPDDLERAQELYRRRQTNE